MLTFLSRRPGASLTSVTEHLGVSCSTASALVDRLVRRQLVSRTEDPQERRCVMLTLTLTGSQHLRQTREATCVHLASVLADLSPGGLIYVAAELMRLGAAFEETSGSQRR